MTKSQSMLAALDNQDLDLANAYFQEALVEDDRETLLALATYLEQIGFFPQAKTIYQQYCEDMPDLYLSLAQMAHDDGQVEQAFLYLDKIGPDSPVYVERLLVMADFYDSEGLTDLARDKLLEALERRSAPLLIFGLAEIEMVLGHYDNAISSYEQLDEQVLLEQTGVCLYERLGKAYACVGEFEQAIALLEKAIEVAYDDQTLFELATLLVEQGEYQKAITRFRQLTALNPHFEGYHYAYALALKADHQLQAAYALVQEGLARNPFDDTLLLLASQLAYENHDSQKAEQYLLDAKALSDDEEVLWRLVNLYHDQERFEDLVALDSDEVHHVLTKWYLAKGYYQLGEEEKSLSIYQALEPDLLDNPDFLKDYAYLLRAFGYRGKACDLLKRYLHLEPDDLEVLDLLADLE